MNIQQAIATVIEKQNLSREEMTDVMREIMTGECTPAQIGGFLVGLRMKGETVDEVTAAASVMRELVAPVKINNKENLVEIVGTGGDGASTFNISTASTFVLAAAGGRVAKHGNRSLSSSSGSADLLEAAGVNLQLTPEQVAECVEEIGLGFMFAPLHHSAMKHAIGPRKEMAVRTIFNVLGPLTNPAGTPNQLLGVYSEEWLEPLAEVLKKLGSNHVMVIHSEDGLDEISIAAPTKVCELVDGEIKTYSIKPEDFNVERGSLSDLKVDSAEESLSMVQSALENQPGPARDIVIMNAGAAIYVAGIANTLSEGMEKAKEVIKSGKAKEKLAALVEKTQTYQA
ncbi:MAG TPA: anthranilate phosphoribosyltransferase [Chromatiales bacterium]|nr:anthranilate phosphoribosyltransferase [Chromatiales bacterium]